MTDSVNNKSTFGHYNVKPPQQAHDEQAPAAINLTIPTEYAGQRLDQALAKLLPQWSRSRLQTWISENHVLLDGRNTTIKQKVWGNESVHINPPEIPGCETVHQPEVIGLDVIFEDESLIVINKPAGLVTHPGNGNWQGTLLNALLHHAPQLHHIPRAGIVHRLDKDTSGLLVVAKTLEAQTSLVRQLQQRSVKRQYIALVIGEVVQSGTVDAAIGRHPIHRTKMAITDKGKPARTHYRILESFRGCTLLECRLETGRTHQIRVHMHAIGHPLAGDPVYGGKAQKVDCKTADILHRFTRQALHAWKLGLIHPRSELPLEWEIPSPDDMKVLLQQLRQLNHTNL